MAGFWRPCRFELDRAPDLIEMLLFKPVGTCKLHARLSASQRNVLPRKDPMLSPFPHLPLPPGRPGLEQCFKNLNRRAGRHLPLYVGPPHMVSDGFHTRRELLLSGAELRGGLRERVLAAGSIGWTTLTNHTSEAKAIDSDTVAESDAIVAVVSAESELDTAMAPCCLMLAALAMCSTQLLPAGP